MQRPGAANRLNKLTSAAVLPEGWHKVSPGLWRHDNGEESRVNPSALFTNNNFNVLHSADSPPGQRAGKPRAGKPRAGVAGKPPATAPARKAQRALARNVSVASVVELPISTVPARDGYPDGLCVVSLFNLGVRGLDGGPSMTLEPSKWKLLQVRVGWAAS